MPRASHRRDATSPPSPRAYQRSNNLLVDINCTLDETTLHKGKIGILDHTGRTVAKVKARHIATVPKGK